MYIILRLPGGTMDKPSTLMMLQLLLSHRFALEIEPGRLWESQIVSQAASSCRDLKTLQVFRFIYPGMMYVLFVSWIMNMIMIVSQHASPELVFGSSFGIHLSELRFLLRKFSWETL